MTYSPPIDSAAADFNFNEKYVVITDPLAVDFDFSDAGEPTGPEYRKPPLAVSYGYQSEQAPETVFRGGAYNHQVAIPLSISERQQNSDAASGLQLTAADLPWSAVPKKDRRENPYSGSEASPLSLSAYPWLWGTVTTRDDPAGYGEQAWDKQSPKENYQPQQFNEAKDHNVSGAAGYADTVMNWQPQTIEVEPEDDGALNLSRAPYTPPAALVVNFELVPEALLIITEPPTRSVDAQPATPAWSLKAALDGRTIHPWDRKPRLGTEVEFPNTSEPDPPGGEPPDEPEIKRTYIVMNASSLVVLPSETPLDFADMSIALDADSFAWTMSCSILNRASMEQIKPEAAGPAEVLATINGYQWRFIIERYSLDKRFAKETYNVKGVSRSQLLAAPYAPKRTGRLDTQNNAYQVMSQQLQFTGFSVDRQQGLTDYAIPAGAWGWDNKTALEVISELAASQGAMVVPDRETDVLHIRHRYALAGPWSYDSLPIESVDAIIQDTMTISYASQWEPQPEYNAVFVSGVTDGVAVDVVRQGTAGDKAAPDIFGDLNVDQYQCRERGLAEIAATGNQEIVTLETWLPTTGAPGLLEPLMLAEIRDTIEPSKTWRGNVLSNTINVSKPGTGKVTQTVKIERHHY